MIIKRPDRSAHWYRRDGTPYYTVEKLDGSGPRPTTIRDAFKAGAYRSVTNVLGVLDKPGLDFWKAEQTILSSLTLPRLDGEDLHTFAERVIVDSQEQARKAAEAGTRLHELAGGWLISGEIPAPDSESRLLAPFQEWCLTNLDAEDGMVAAPESVVLNHSYGYAGRVDLPVRFKDGSIAHVDLKTQEVKLDAKAKPKPEFYDEWALQLAAYSRCVFADGSYPAPMPWRLISLVVDRRSPGCYMHEWTDPANPLASAEPHFQAFLAAAKVWTYFKGGTPGIDLKKAA